VLEHIAVNVRDGLMEKFNTREFIEMSVDAIFIVLWCAGRG